MQTELHFDNPVCQGRQTPYRKMEYVNRFPSRELDDIQSECQSLINGSISDQQAPAQLIS